MSLIIEDGSVVAGANSYFTAASASSYLGTRGTYFLSASTAEQENALIEAGMYLNSLPWRGTKKTRDQTMEWPRLYFYDSDGYQYANDVVPTRVKWAQAEAAEEFLAGNTLLTTLKPTDRIKRKKIDVLEKEYFPSASSGKTKFPKIDAMLRGLLTTYGVIARS